ncbi:hypothetical protein ES703_63148 [subsurface metagenome]
MQFFAEVPAVVAPEYDNGVIRIGTFIQGIDYPAHAGIYEADRCEVALYGLSPLFVLDDLFMVAFGSCHPSAYRGDIVKVVFVDIRQSYLFGRIHIKIFWRYVPGQMRAEEAAAEEKRLVVLFAQLADSPGSDFSVTHRLVGHIYRPPVEMCGFRNAVYRPVRRHRVVRLVLLLGWEILVPGGRVGEAAVVDFAAANDAVAVGHKVLGQCGGIGEYRRLSPGLGIEVNAGR